MIASGRGFLPFGAGDFGSTLRRVVVVVVGYVAGCGVGGLRVGPRRRWRGGGQRAMGAPWRESTTTTTAFAAAFFVGLTLPMPLLRYDRGSMTTWLLSV